VPRSTVLRRGAALAAVLALGSTAAADAQNRGDRDRGDRSSARTFYATTDSNLLLQFNDRRPDRIRDIQSITGLPGGVTLRGIDFRPLTGDLYGVGSDSVVYRVNPNTGIAVSEGPAFTPGLSGNSFGVDFNPTVDKIRVVSDAAQNLRLNVDEGTVLSVDGNLNPGMPQVVGSAYTNSFFSAAAPNTRPPTTLYALDSATNQLFVQNPPNAGTLTMGKRLRIDVGRNTGFDIAGSNNTGYVSTTSSRGRGTSLYKLDVLTGKSRELGRIGGGRRLVITGLAAWQD
jgi:Domain of unknown function (DUF4394)